MREKEEVETESGDCEICHKETDVLNIIPKHKPDGSLITVACTECAEEAGMFCQEHQKPHLGFEDGTTACAKCIDEKVEADDDAIFANFSIQISASPKRKEIIDSVDDYILQMAFITGESEVKSIARAIVTAAQRLRRTPEEIISETAELGPQVLFPGED